jgi:precorrin isomerase
MEEDLDAFLAAAIDEAAQSHGRTRARAAASAGREFEREREALAILEKAQAAHLAVLRLIRAALKQPQYLAAIGAAVPPSCTG